jgi:hypothetical protein
MQTIVTDVFITDQMRSLVEKDGVGVICPLWQWHPISMLKGISFWGTPIK